MTDNAKQSIWRQCDLPGCPLEASIMTTRQTCTYHYNLNGGEADKVTLKIKQNLGYLNKYSEMVRWTMWDWKNKRNRLLDRKQFPLGEKEPYSVYLMRYKQWLEDKLQ